MDNVVIIGPGRMGLALGTALWHEGALDSLLYFGRSLEPPPHPLFDRRGSDGEGASVQYRLGPALIPAGTTVVVLAVPDNVISEIAYELALQGPAPRGCTVLHLAGALSTDVLAPLHQPGYALGSMHPLVAVADPWLAAERLLGAAFALAGEPAALGAARRLVDALGGLSLVIPPALRPVYHAAAVMASNYVVALTAVSMRLLGEAGISEADALRALLPLLRSSLANIEQLGVPAALTGPIPRGDVDTIRSHLARLSPADRVLYCGLGRELLRLGRAAGLDASRADEIESLLASG